MRHAPPAGPHLGIDGAVVAALAPVATAAPGGAARVTVALSGGRDSMVLLEALVRARGNGTVPCSLRAVHVHHGLSAHATAWADFCDAECAARDVPLDVVRVRVARAGGESLEAAARAARHAVLEAQPAEAVVLAHHADDQAETVLLQLLRGAGPPGLAAMSGARRRGAAPWMLRPFLALPARILADYARQHGLRWIEDESNADTRLRRNALRHDVVPALRTAFPGYPATVVRAAQHQAEAAALLDDLAALDAAALTRMDPHNGLVLAAPGLADLARARPDRARNVLRWFLRQHGLRAPSTARLASLLAQCLGPASAASTRAMHDGRGIGIGGGWITLLPSARPLPYDLPWRGEARYALPGGTLHATPVAGRGLAVAGLDALGLAVRSRRGGERLRTAQDRPRVAVSAFLQARHTPMWQRAQWPVLWDARGPVAVPGLGVDPRYAADAQRSGLELSWEPSA